MKDTTHVRKGKEIRAAAPDGAVMYKSMNQAKKASRKLQMEQDGALGRGTVRVLPFTPKKRKRKQAGKFKL